MDEEQQLNWKLFLVEGIIMGILGILAVLLPSTFTYALEQVLGWIFLLGGLFQGYQAIAGSGPRGVVLGLLVAILYMGSGIFLIAYPITGVLTLTFVLAIFFLVEGFVKILWAIQVRHVPNWGLLAFSGIMAILLGLVVYMGWPTTAAWFLGLLVGCNMLIFGCSRIALALAIKKMQGPGPGGDGPLPS